MAFSDSSRYALVATTSVLVDGRPVQALKLRSLGRPDADDHLLAGHERLDLLAYQVTQDGSRFWHVADANDALDARSLEVPGSVIRLPRLP